MDFITKAEDKAEAIGLVDDWLNDHTDQEFYEDYLILLVDDWLNDHTDQEFYEDYLILTKKVKRVCEFKLKCFQKLLYATKKIEAKCECDIVKGDDRFLIGRAHLRLGEIMIQAFCEDAPYWNINTEDWELPNKDDWAVMVKLW